MAEEVKETVEARNSIGIYIEKARAVYQECKSVAEHYEYDDVLFNNGGKQSDIMDEWARQINKTNLCRQKEKDLNFILVWLQEVKGELSNTPSSKSMNKQVDILIENVKSLLKVYITISQMQGSILKYYERGGATF